MKDFIHKTLINAGGKDAVSNMLTGAAMGAGANTALGAIQGDFDIIGNATSGALLGAGGGAALRHAGDKYTSGIAALAKAGNKDIPTNTFHTGIFTHAIKEEADFMGNPEMMKRAQGMAGGGQTAKAAGATTEAPVGGSVNTSSASNQKAQPSVSRQIQDEIDQGNARNATEALRNLRSTAKEQSDKNVSTLNHKRTDVGKGRSYGDRAAERQQAKKDSFVEQKKAEGRAITDQRAANKNRGDDLEISGNNFREMWKDSQEKSAIAKNMNNDDIKAGGYVSDGKGGWKLPGVVPTGEVGQSTRKFSADEFKTAKASARNNPGVLASLSEQMNGTQYSALQRQLEKENVSTPSVSKSKQNKRKGKK